ncbi:heme biosynthesis protein HemY [Lutibaculum baratangense]|uniref:HemY-like protein n=1 Tax=Lutibaculum baratangense AMV1 TaxID=631454 RepID=V4T7I0_9HYPH|nr:heme biosynthesis HemY N-terminal domain-containing protein [Lutibaculum baratangense]ESR22578.1 hemY-like protein [Lutibaculum baratangense AMV1]
MIRAFLYVLVVAALAIAASWLADLPGAFQLTVAGYQFETSLLVAFVLLLLVVAAVMILWWLISAIFRSPAAVSGYFRARRRDKGYHALSRGMVAAAAGDVRLTKHYSAEARRLAPRESLTVLLAAQAAQLSGDRAAARAAFEAMLARPDTELLGYRGLYIEAQRDGDYAAARTYAEEAARRAPSLPWAGNALLDYQTREHDWDEALATVKRNADARLIDRKAAARQRAVLLTAKAQETEEKDPDAALAQAQEAHKLAPDLVPAAVIAGRLLSATGSSRQAAKIVERTWKEHPHPDLAEVYAHARQGDSAQDRLKRVRALADKRPHEAESRMAVAVAAIEAREWPAAREALEPLLRERPTRRTCMLMAEIEEGERGDAGRVREWLSRALHAPRDAAWVADGYVSEEWQPVSPVTGELDTFEWTTPPEFLTSGEVEEERRAVMALESERPADEPVVPAAEPHPIDHEPTTPAEKEHGAEPTTAPAPVAAPPAEAGERAEAKTRSPSRPPPPSWKRVPRRLPPPAARRASRRRPSRGEASRSP